MRPFSTALVLAVLGFGCNASEAGYHGPAAGCEAGAFCAGIEVRGRFNAIHGFLRSGEVVAYRNPGPDGTAAAWLSTPDAELEIAPRVVRSSTRLQADGAAVVAVPRGEDAEQYDEPLFGGRIDLRRWTPGNEAPLLAADVIPGSWDLSPTGEWLWTVEGRSPTMPYGNCGLEVLRNLRDGRTETLEDECVSRAWTARFTPDGRALTAAGPVLHVDLETGARTPADPAWRLDIWFRDSRFLFLDENLAPEPWNIQLRLLRADDLVELLHVESAVLTGARAVSPDGAWFAYEATTDPSTYNQLTFVNLEDGRGWSSGPRGVVDTHVAFSPAGRFAAYLLWSDLDLSDLVLVDLETGTHRVLDSLASQAQPRGAPERTPITFDATGNRLVYTRGSRTETVRNGERELVIVDVATGTTRALAPAASCRGCVAPTLPLSAAVSPDRRWLAWISNPGELYLLDLLTPGDGVRISLGRVTDVVFGDSELAWISDGYLLVAPLER